MICKVPCLATVSGHQVTPLTYCPVNTLPDREQFSTYYICCIISHNYDGVFYHLDQVHVASMITVWLINKR